MPGHATAQLIGDRSHQCDATATFTHEGRRAYVLLDGIGSNDEVRAWTRGTARRLAGAAARSGAGAGLRAVHAALAAEPARRVEGAEPPCAVAVVATTETGGELEVAWCGDSRAYLLEPDAVAAVRLTTDHNMRRHLLEMGMDPGPYARNVVTSFLGDPRPDPLIDVVRVPALGRLLLASDGAYEPLEDAGRGLEEYLRGPVRRVARELVEAAVGLGTGHADNATVLVADLGWG